MVQPDPLAIEDLRPAVLMSRALRVGGLPRRPSRGFQDGRVYLGVID